ncbi:MAG TPA: DeoR family transcriptional regulator [Dehalococcoidia bacterium]|jgi:predicted ArsR family transcriptional regulator|nr:DeoR family transcriptional regulator [Dehalococcoidia bacterium]
MQTTKHQILELLKRTGSATIDEAAGALTIASMTARQHLLGLERDGLVQSEKVRRSNGRPHFLFYLTPKGDEMFPRRFDLLAGILLDVVASLTSEDIDSLSGEQKRSLLIQRAADRLADDYRFPVEGRTLEERVDQLTSVLHRIGGFAEWRKIPEGYEIRDYNCVFARLMVRQNDGCLGHLRLITHLLQWPARHEVVVDGRVQCCRYIVSPDATGAEEGLLLNA